jgi:hypothetical protein
MKSVPLIVRINTDRMKFAFAFILFCFYFESLYIWLRVLYASI